MSHKERAKKAGKQDRVVNKKRRKYTVMRGCLCMYVRAPSIIWH